MKKFVVKTILFILILLLYFGANALINYCIYSLAPVRLEDKRVLIIGDSHAQQGINPNLFNSAQNICQPAEPYVLTYWKLKKIVKSYRPDTIILGFGPHNIAHFHDLKFSKDAELSWSTELFKRSYAIEHFHEIDDKVSIDYLTYYKVLWKEIGFYPKFKHDNYIGYYYSSPACWDLSKWETTIKKQYFLKNNALGGLSDISINYLDSIVNLCEAKNMTLVMASSPVYKVYFDHIPTGIMNEFDLLKNKYANKVIMIDRTQEVYPDSLLLDADHLNERGANRFTKEMMEDLKQKRSAL